MAIQDYFIQGVHVRLSTPSRYGVVQVYENDLVC
jgi:hypothetical protein